MLDALMQDVRFALRALARQPGFTAIVLMTLALGIGANTAVFTVVNAVVLQPLPFEAPGQLVRLTADLEGTGTTDVGMSPPELFDYRDETDLFDGVAGLYPIDANLAGVDQPERVEVLLVSPEYFDILRVRPALGRVFSPAQDDLAGIADVVVISDALWARRFGRAADVLGRTLRIDDDPFRIVGVAPPTFRHPGRTLRGDVDLWAPAGYRSDPFPAPTRRGYFLAGSLARLKAGVTPSEAQRRLDLVGERIRAAYPTDYPVAAGWRPRVVPLHADVVGNVRPALFMLLAAVGLVLLIGCANIAGLQLARSATRHRELAVRRALGSGRLSLARLLLTESLVLAAAGGALGLLVAFWGIDALLALTPSELPRLHEVRMSGAVVAFTALASMATGLLFGLAPAIQFSRPAIADALRDARGASTRPRRASHSALVVAEFALATVLVVAAVLLVRSFRAVQSVDPGFDGSGVLTARVWLPRPNDSARGTYLAHPPRLALFEEILTRLQHQPGVERAAIFLNLPLDGQAGAFTVTIDGRAADATGAIPAVAANFVSPDFFAVLKVPVVEGRTFGREDGPQGAPVAIVNREMERRYFGGSAMGRRVKLGGAASAAPWMTVVGVVGNTLNDRLEGAPAPMLYRPMTQATNLLFGIAVRTSGDPHRLAAVVVDAVRRADPDVPTFAVRTMDEVLATATASRRFSTQILGGFALLALFLAAIGISGVMSYLVNQQTREIGIRMALGARPQTVVGLVAGHALRLAVIGTLAGTLAVLVLAPLATRAMSGLLFNVRIVDTTTLAAVGVLLVGTALVASALPARRAARVDPVEALRAD